MATTTTTERERLEDEFNTALQEQYRLSKQVAEETKRITSRRDVPWNRRVELVKRKQDEATARMAEMQDVMDNASKKLSHLEE